MKRALVLGGSGMLGGNISMALESEGYSVMATFNRTPPHPSGYETVRLDASDHDSLVRMIRESSPNLIVNAIALPSVDRCDLEPDLAFAVNSEPQRIISQEARDIGSKTVFISTSNVFGPSERFLTERDPPGPISAYGKLKLQAEQHALSCPGSLVLRTDQIYGWASLGQKKSFVERTLDSLGAGQEVRVCADWWNCPTFVDDLSSSLLLLLGGGHSGVFHAVGPSYLNRYSWARRIAAIFGFDPSHITAINSSDLALPAIRSNCALSNSKIINTVGARFHSVEEGLLLMRERKRMR